MELICTQKSLNAKTAKNRNILSLCAVFKDQDVSNVLQG